MPYVTALSDVHIKCFQCFHNTRLHQMCLLLFFCLIYFSVHMSETMLTNWGIIGVAGYQKMKFNTFISTEHNDIDGLFEMPVTNICI